MLPKSCTTTAPRRLRPRRRILAPRPFAVALILIAPTVGWLIARLVMTLRDAS